MMEITGQHSIYLYTNVNLLSGMKDWRILLATTMNTAVEVSLREPAAMR